METKESFACLYETVSPLSTPPPHPSSTLTDSESYTVIRHEISACSVQSTSIGTAAVDFFSLDVDAEDVVAASVPTPSNPAEKVEEKERILEGTWFRANYRFRSPMLQLHKEIVDFANFLAPTPEEEASRDEAIKSVFHVIKYIWPNCEVKVFGSFKTGLHLPTSDVDVVILGSNIMSPKHGLLALSRDLSQKQIAKKIQVIAEARVPIIKFVENKSGISFDISFDMQNGPKAAEFIKNAVSQWAPLRPLCLILKIFMQQRGLNEVYTGGIGSYALLVMLIVALQTYTKSGDSSEHNLGVLLVNFFDLYGCRLNTSDVGISCIGGGTFFSKIKRGFPLGKQPRISIEDPQFTENDIGKSSFNFFMVKSAFAMAFKTLTNEKTILALGPKRSILGTIIQPDASLLARKGGSSRSLIVKEMLPGASGDSLPQQKGDGHDLHSNCQLKATINLPDAALLEIKGGSSGNLMIKDLLPGAAGDPLPQQNGNGQDLHSNGQLNDGDDGILHCDNLPPQNDASHSSEKIKRPMVKSVTKVKETADENDSSNCSRNLTAKDSLTGASGDPTPQQNGDGQDLHSNFQSNNEDDETLHRDNLLPQNDASHSSKMINRPTTVKRSVRKLKETADENDSSISSQKKMKLSNVMGIKKVEQVGNGRILRSGKNGDARILRSGKKC